MATKNIARSALEGGRHSYNKWERRHSHNEERAQVRDYLNRVLADPENADDEHYDGIRPVHKEFTDKLAPMYRWLEKQVGRSWADVRSEVFHKFDTRTTAGRHITFDHLLNQVIDTQSGFDDRGAMMNPNIDVIKGERKGYYNYGGSAEYYVDENGILCENPNSYKNRRRTRHYLKKVSEQEYINIGAWLRGCIIGQKDGKYYWFVPTDGIWEASWQALDQPAAIVTGTLRYFLRENGPYKVQSTWFYDTPSSFTWTGMSHGDHWEHIETPFSFRQRGELSKEELEIFLGLDEYIRKQILAFGKGR